MEGTHFLSKPKIMLPNSGRKLGGNGFMKVRPLLDRILVKRVEENEKTAGGIIIPDSAKEKPQEGVVVATGNGRITDEGKTIELEVKPGDRILFGKYVGSDTIDIDDHEHLLLRESDVLAVIE
jgi:chaperonin GroES